MSLTTDRDGAAVEVEGAVSNLGYTLRRLRPGHASLDELTSDAATVRVTTHESSSYRRALWTVASLNLGFGAIEVIGGFWASSQALKADALDFFGDGSITLLGLLAIRWPAKWRARTALLQGIFLGILGIGVLVAAAYRAFVVNEPQAEVMGILGFFAFLINVGCAAILMKHREGDANVRAVWLFSRNDAIGNMAVVVAAGLVAWTGTRWPDLAVAGAVAALFLHSAWSIVKDAKTELI